MKKVILIATILFLAAGCTKPMPKDPMVHDSGGVEAAPGFCCDPPKPQISSKAATKIAPTAPQIAAVDAPAAPKTEPEQDKQIDQNTLDNIKQDGQIADAQNRIGAIENKVNAPAPAPAPTPPAQTTPPLTQKDMLTFEIISPIAGKGLGRNYVASPEVKDESNYIEIGLVVRDSAGNPLKTEKIDVEATDSMQNKHMNGTGTMVTLYDDQGNPQLTPYYPFHYEFHTAGPHVITFLDGKISATPITLEVN